MLFFMKISVSSGGGSGVATESEGVIAETTNPVTHETFHGVLEYANETPVDVAWIVWPLLIVGIALLGGAAAWTDRTVLVWVSAFALLGIAVLGAMTIGIYAAPAALLALGSAVLLHASGRHERTKRVERAVLSKPPTMLEAVLKTLFGAVAVSLGLVMAYYGVSAGLSDACAVETASCVVENTHWDRVAGTAIGSVLSAVGVRAISKQIRSARIVGRA